VAVASLSRLGYSYPGAPEPALDGVDLVLEPGLTVLAGPSGAGKSTLLRVFNGLVPHFHGGRLWGSARVAGLAVAQTPTRELARQVGFVFQDPEAQFVYGLVEREVAFGLENLGLPAPEMTRRVEEALAAAGAGHLRGRAVATLSGGERQRVALASALALRPPLLALDEPTSQLDREGAEAILEACLRLAGEGHAVIVSEHRLDRLLPAAGRLLLADAGRVRAVEPGRLPHPPAVVELGRRLGWQPLPLTVEEARARRPELRPPSSPPYPPRVRGGEIAWSLRGVAVAPGPQPLLEAVELAGAAGECVVLVGPNGGGKTTLLRLLAGVLKAAAGRVQQRPGRRAYLPQDPTALLHLPSVREEVELTLRRAGERESADRVLASLGLQAVAGRYPRDLSTGERQRAALAAVLAGRPALALLDEPTRGMDGGARRALAGLVAGLKAGGTAVVLATHDSELAAAVGDRVVEVGGGGVRELGPPERALSDGSLYATQIGRLYPGGPVTVDGVLARL